MTARLEEKRSRLKGWNESLVAKRLCARATLESFGSERLTYSPFNYEAPA